MNCLATLISVPDSLLIFFVFVNNSIKILKTQIVSLMLCLQLDVDLSLSEASTSLHFKDNPENFAYGLEEMATLYYLTILLKKYYFFINFDFCNFTCPLEFGYLS
ncbi:hypothetical protein TCON_2751 [Astathelohania contejeani]|uniref:Uncharacterized protein n=1 Tax=Astathelohania contejeani TaxID=164912 RepID=A0ABQ7HV44_9MICR|nr:hypothetical protein TCON_2751 [Thelohania contejeani]